MHGSKSSIQNTKKSLQGMEEERKLSTGLIHTQKSAKCGMNTF